MNVQDIVFTAAGSSMKGGQPRHIVSSSVKPAALSMIEMGVALLVIVVFTALALGGAQRILGQSEVTEEATNLAMLSSAIRQTRTGAGYSSDIMSDLVAINGIPTNMAFDKANSKLSNRWTGDVTFDTPSGDAGNFVITYAGIPKEECTQLLMTVKAGVLRSVGTFNLNNLTAADASSLCSASSNTVTWSSAVQ